LAGDDVDEDEGGDGHGAGMDRGEGSRTVSGPGCADGFRCACRGNRRGEGAVAVAGQRLGRHGGVIAVGLRVGAGWVAVGGGEAAGGMNALSPGSVAPVSTNSPPVFSPPVALE
jgi:hypothetical protein